MLLFFTYDCNKSDHGVGVLSFALLFNCAAPSRVQRSLFGRMTLKPANARAQAGIGLDACALLGLEQFNGSEDTVKDSGMLLEFILGRHHDCQHEVTLKIQGEQ